MLRPVTIRHLCPRTKLGLLLLPLLGTVALTLSSPAAAKPKKKADKAEKNEPSSFAKRAPYGMAGCGLGTLVVERDAAVPQIGAFTLNSTGVQTFGISSGTSNCVGGHTQIADVEQEVFVTANLASLSKEAAQGSGQHLNGLAQVFGCSSAVGEPTLGHLSQERYDSLFTAAEPGLVLQNYLHAIRSNPVLAKDCTKVAAG